MIGRRSPFGMLRCSALAVVLGMLGGGCVMAGVYRAPGGETGAPATRSAPRAASTGAAGGRTGAQIPQSGCSPVALQLIRVVNAYRAENSLPSIPASPSLCTVAAAHTRDLAEHAPHARPPCNAHSWSDRGDWTPCCYTADHAKAECMWNKPRELTRYTGNGYENAAEGITNPAEALQGWRSSPAHNEVILNRGIWRSPWRAIGADVHEGFAVLWFGKEPDPVQ